MKLAEEDRRAIDLLLDQGLSATASGSGRAGYATPAADAIRQRIAGVAKLLSALNEMPIAEPPEDLVAKTLRRIERTVEIDARAIETPSIFKMDGPVA